PHAPCPPFLALPTPTYVPQASSLWLLFRPVGPPFPPLPPNPPPPPPASAYARRFPRSDTIPSWLPPDAYRWSLLSLLSTVSCYRPRVSTCRRTLIGSNAGSGSDRPTASTSPLPRRPRPDWHPRYWMQQGFRPLLTGFHPLG